MSYQRTVQELIFDPRTFGAVGDGVHDDTAALQAAINLSMSIPGSRVELVQPPAFYVTTAELTATALTMSAVGVGVTIKATAPMQSVLTTSDTNNISDVFLDANGVAEWGLLRLGDDSSVYTRINVTNAKRNNIHAPPYKLPHVISAVIQTGPGPAITITQRDPNYGLTNPAGAWVLKVMTGGPLGTAQLALSSDGGITFSIITQTAFANINVGFSVNGVQLSLGGSAFVGDTGYRAQCGAGAYSVNTTYRWNITVQVGSENDNSNVTFDQPSGGGMGQVFSTAAIAPSYGATTPTIVAGTIAITHLTINGAIGVGTGTTFLALDARQGDFFFVGPPINVNVPIVCVLDDTHVAFSIGDLHIVGSFAGWTTTAGLDYAVGEGYAYFEEFWPQNGQARILAPKFNNLGSNGMRLGGQLGAGIYQPTIEDAQFAGVYVSMPNSFTQGQLVREPLIDHPVFTHPTFSVGQAVGVSVYLDNQISDCEIREPVTTTGNDATGGGLGDSFAFNEFCGSGAVFITHQQRRTTYNGANVSSLVGAFAIQDITVQVVQSGPGVSNQTLPAPDMGTPFDQTGGTSSISLLGPAGVTTFTGAPTIAVPDQQGVTVDVTRTVRYRNQQPGAWFVFVDGNWTSAFATGLTLAAPFVTIGYLEEIYFTTGYNAKWIQSRFQQSWIAPGSGNPGPGSNVVFTNDATPTTIYQWSVQALRGTANGLQFEANIKAETNSAVDYASWSGVKGAWDSQSPPAQVGVLSFDEVRGNGPAGSVPFGWQIIITQDTGQGIIQVVGDGAHLVKWRIDVAQHLPP